MHRCQQSLVHLAPALNTARCTCDLQRIASAVNVSLGVHATRVVLSSTTTTDTTFAENLNLPQGSQRVPKWLELRGGLGTCEDSTLSAEGPLGLWMCTSTLEQLHDTRNPVSVC